ncbi:MAG: glutamate--tRNA ligase [Phycisphaerales bacterium]|nr:glutamate--tRNA ligase [Phycisphaerales bacterium]
MPTQPELKRPQVVTRFAPSPTGHLHIGGARTALFCWAYSRAEAARQGTPPAFVLRIEDTDQARSSESAAKGMCEDLAWLGITWDEGPRHERTGDAGDHQVIGGDPRHVGPFFQAQRLHLYNKYIMQLVEQEKAFPAFEKAEELDAKRREATSRKQTYHYDNTAALAIPLVERLHRMKPVSEGGKGEPHVVRLRVTGEPITVQDQVLGEVSYAAGEVDDFVLRKADGFPTYHFAVVIDDETMGVTHVLRAQEHLNNTPKHVALQQALGFASPIYAHMPIICNMDGSKMSKRDKAKTARAAAKTAIQKDPAISPGAIAQETGLDPAALADFLAQNNDSIEIAEALGRRFGVTLPEVEVEDFRAAGYLPEAITNFIALLGWSPGGDIEKFDTAFIAERFDVHRIGKTSAKFDRMKLLSFNTDAITTMAPAEFNRRFHQWARDYAPPLAAVFPDSAAPRWEMLCRAVQPRCKTFKDAADQTAFLLVADDQVTFDPKAVEKVLKKIDPATGSGAALLAGVVSVIEGVVEFKPETIHAAIEAFAATKNLNIGKIAQPLRVALTGSTVSPPIDATLALLGKASSLARIHRCLQTA